MSLPNFGVYAIVDNADGYIKAMKSIDKANDAAASAVKDTAKSFGNLDKAFDSTTAIAVAAGNLISTAITGAFNLVGNAISSVLNGIGNLAKGIFDMGVTFSQTMANVSSITGLAGKDLQGLSKELIAIGADSAAGPQKVAEAYYDIASGVGDVASRLPILNAAIATSEAGQSNLTATTNGLVSVMNAYSFAAKDAAHVSDVFTMTVGKGVGTMDQFVGAMSPLAGLVAANKIKFDEFGAAMAFMTMKGIPAEQAATQIKNAITQLSRATPAATRAIKAMGEKSIEASIANNGFAATLGLLQEGAKKTHQNFTTMIGSVEALQAATALGGADFQKFFDTFIDGVDGATAAARELQRADVSFQLKLMDSRFQAIGLSIAGAVLPAFNKFLTVANKALAGLDWKKIGAGLDYLSERLGIVADQIINDLGKALENVDWDSVFDSILFAITEIGNALALIDWGALATQLGNAIKGIAEWVAGIDWAEVSYQVANFVNGVIAAAQQVGAFITTAITAAANFKTQWDSFWAGASTSVNAWVTNVQLVFTQVQTTISGAIQPIVDAIQLGLDSINTAWNNLFGGTGSLASNVSQGFTSAQTYITEAITPLTDAFRPLVDSLSSLWNSVFGAGGSLSIQFNEAMTSVQTAVGNVIGPLTAHFTEITDGIIAVWGPVFGTNGTVSKPVSDALDAVKAAAQNALNGIKAAFAAIGAAVSAALAPIITTINAILAGIAALQAFAGGGGGSSGGSGGGGGKGSVSIGRSQARGGDLTDGLTVLGEHGREAVWKAGNSVSVLTAQQTRDILGGSMHMAGGGGSGTRRAKLERNGGYDFSSPAAIYDLIRSYISTVPIPIQAGGGNNYNDNSSSSNMNINFNGVQNSESAMQRFALLKATGAY